MRVKDTVKLAVRLGYGETPMGLHINTFTDERFSNPEPSYMQGATPHAGLKAGTEVPVRFWQTVREGHQSGIRSQCPSPKLQIHL